MTQVLPIPSPPQPGRIALSLTATAPITSLVEEAVRAERFGFDEVWTAEAASWDAVSLLSAVAARTSRVSLGVGVLNVTSRSSHALATAAASISSLSDGRFTLGLGTASPTIVSAWHGGELALPVSALRHTAEQVIKLLAGERVIDPPMNVRLAVRPSGRVPVVLAALGPKMLDLAVQIADGIVTVFATPSWTQDVRRKCGAIDRPFRVVTRLFVPLPGDDGQALDGVRDLLATYSAVPAYRSHFTRLGFGGQALAASSAIAAKDPAAARRAIDDDMIASFSICGALDEQVRAVRSHVAAGTDVAVLAFLPLGRHDHDARELLEDAQQRFAERWRAASDVGGRSAAIDDDATRDQS